MPFVGGGGDTTRDVYSESSTRRRMDGHQHQWLLVARFRGNRIGYSFAKVVVYVVNLAAPARKLQCGYNLRNNHNNTGRASGSEFRGEGNGSVVTLPRVAVNFLSSPPP